MTEVLRLALPCSLEASQSHDPLVMNKHQLCRIAIPNVAGFELRKSTKHDHTGDTRKPSMSRKAAGVAVSYHKTRWAISMDLVGNLNGSSPPFCNSSFALLRRLQVPYYVIKLWVFKYLRSFKRCPSFDVRVSQLERFAVSFHSHQQFIDEDLSYEIAKRGDSARAVETDPRRGNIVDQFT